MLLDSILQNGWRSKSLRLAGAIFTRWAQSLNLSGVHRLSALSALSRAPDQYCLVLSGCISCNLDAAAFKIANAADVYVREDDNEEYGVEEDDSLRKHVTATGRVSDVRGASQNAGYPNTNKGKGGLRIRNWDGEGKP